MRIVKPYARIVASNPFAAMGIEMGRTLMHQVEWFARISHRAEDAQTDNSWERFIKSVVIDKGDWSVTEHCTVSVDAVVDRGITHEWVRHRIGAYTQESTRFVNYVKKMPASFIYPIVGVECARCLAGNQVERYNGTAPESSGWFHHDNARCAYHTGWLDLIDDCERTYIALVTQGWRPQEARSVFPNALASRITVTYDLRMWRHFFMMRTTREAHPQMRQVTIPLLEEFKRSIPILFDDIEPNRSQAESIARAR